MKKQVLTSVEDYLASFPESTREALESVRRVVHAQVERVAGRGALEEHVRYSMAGFELRGRPVIYLAGWKKHLSIYPSSRAVEDELGAALAPYRAKDTRGTLKFSLTEPLPLDLIARVIAVRTREAALEAETKTKSTSKTKSASQAKSTSQVKSASKTKRVTKAAPKKKASAKVSPARA